MKARRTKFSCMSAFSTDLTSPGAPLRSPACRAARPAFGSELAKESCSDASFGALGCVPDLLQQDTQQVEAHFTIGTVGRFHFGKFQGTSFFARGQRAFKLVLKLIKSVGNRREEREKKKREKRERKRKDRRGKGEGAREKLESAISVLACASFTSGKKEDERRRHGNKARRRKTDARFQKHLGRAS